MRSCCCGVLALSCLACLPLSASATENVKLKAFGLGGMEKLNVCVAPWSNMVKCVKDIPQIDYTGYEVEVFKRVVKEDGLVLGKDYSFVCVDWNTLIATMKGLQPQPPCNMSAAGLWMSDVNRAAGIRYSVPTYTSLTRLLINTDFENVVTNRNPYWFLEVFGKDVWLMSGLCGIFITMILMALEYLNKSVLVQYQTWRAKHKKTDSGRLTDSGHLEAHAKGLPEMLHVHTIRATTRRFFAELSEFHVGLSQAHGIETPCSIRIMTAAYGFFLFVLLAIYNAEMISYLVMEEEISIDSLDSLTGSRVGAYWIDLESEAFRNFLQPFNLELVSLRWDTPVDEHDILTGLRVGCDNPDACFSMFDKHTGPYPQVMGREHEAKPNPGRLRALVIADSFTDVHRAQHCELAVVGKPMKSVYQALAYAPQAISGISEEVIEHFNRQILKLQASRTLQTLQEDYLGGARHETNCKKAGKSTLSFGDIKQLFLIVLACTVVALVWEIVRWIERARRYMREAKNPSSSAGEPCNQSSDDLEDQNNSQTNCTARIPSQETRSSSSSSIDSRQIATSSGPPQVARILHQGHSGEDLQPADHHSGEDLPPTSQWRASLEDLEFAAEIIHELRSRPPRQKDAAYIGRDTHGPSSHMEGRLGATSTASF